jgi:hypothetical protein
VSAHGSVSIAKSGASLAYTPRAGFRGGDTFTYTIADESGDRATTSVMVWVRTVVGKFARCLMFGLSHDSTQPYLNL